VRFPRQQCVALEEGETMVRRISTLLIIVSLLLAWNVSPPLAQAPDGTIKITSRMVAPGIGLSWGDGVLTYKGQTYPFTFQANGLFRNVDAAITAAELSGQVFNLKSPEDIGGNYQKVEAKNAESSAGSSATMKNEKGVVVNLVSTIEGRKFNLAREGLNIELKKPK
jgi:hypothetical protein